MKKIFFKKSRSLIAAFSSLVLLSQVGCKSRTFNSESKGLFGFGDLFSEKKGEGFSYTKAPEANYTTKDNLQALVVYVHGVNTSGNDEPFRSAQQWASKGYYPMRLLWTRHATKKFDVSNLQTLFTDMKEKGVAQMSMQALGAKAVTLMRAVGDTLFPNQQEDVVWLSLMRTAPDAFLSIVEEGVKKNPGLKEIRVVCHSMGCQLGIRLAQATEKWNKDHGSKLAVRLDLLDPYVSNRTFKDVNKNAADRQVAPLDEATFPPQEHMKDRLMAWLKDFGQTSPLWPTIYSSVTADAFFSEFGPYANTQRMSDSWLHGAGFGKVMLEQHNKIRDAYFGSLAAATYPVVHLPGQQVGPAFYAGLANEELALRKGWSVEQISTQAKDPALNFVDLFNHQFKLVRAQAGPAASAQLPAAKEPNDETRAIREAAASYQDIAVLREEVTTPVEEERSIDDEFAQLRAELLSKDAQKVVPCAETLSRRSAAQMVTQCSSALAAEVDNCRQCLGVSAGSKETKEQVKACALQVLAANVAMQSRFKATGAAEDLGRVSALEANSKWTLACFPLVDPSKH